ncbi:glycosyltransferase family 2 protein [Fulvivirga ligni]|uniref:glycosyltransferase family 2 protein n=1 Tax=Fulvivirga ligni TaxID=2904246 RepID=UPI001F220514|nr:glycosyltransferase family 2 protein [Fulvivirga ligni]UII22663.1 glycosyltransferase [Fulvivirga ligni]
MANECVSIVTIVYNNREYIQQTIDSVASQNYPNIEYLVIDGGSTDGTINILKKNDNNIAHWISEKDRGISDAFNKGLRFSSGALIGFLNSDDWYEPDVINNIMSFASEHECLNKPCVLYGKTYRVLKDGQRINKKNNTMGWHVSVPFSHCSSFITREYYEQYGDFDDKFKIAMDVDFLMRGLGEAEYIEMPMFVGNQRDGGVSDKNRLNGYKEYFKIAASKVGFLNALVGFLIKLSIHYLKKRK